MAQWWCLLDPICCSLLAAAGVATITVFRRLDSIQRSHRREHWTCRAILSHCMAGAVLAGSTGLAASIAACELWPTSPRLVMSVVVLAGCTMDLATSAARKEILATLKARIVAAIEALTKGKGP